MIQHGNKCYCVWTRYRSRAGGLIYDPSKQIFVPERLQFHTFMQSNLEEEAVLHFVTVRWACHTPANAIKGQRNCEIAWKRWKKSQSSERLVWPIHAFCKTIIRVVASVCQKCPVAFRWKLLKFQRYMVHLREKAYVGFV